MRSRKVVVDAVELGGELVVLLFQCPSGVDFRSRKMSMGSRERVTSVSSMRCREMNAPNPVGGFGESRCAVVSIFARGFDGVVGNGRLRPSMKWRTRNEIKTTA